MAIDNTNTKILQGAGAQGAASATPKQEDGQVAATVTKTEASSPTTAELLAQIEEQKAQMAQLQQERAAEKALALSESVGAQLVQLTRDGYSCPAVFEDEKSLLLTLNDSQRAAYLELQRKKPQTWRPGRQSDPVQALSGARREDARAEQDFDDIKKLMGTVST